MNMLQVLAEIGRLHMENIALRAENEELRQALASTAGTPPVSIDAYRGRPGTPEDTSDTEPEPPVG